MAQYRRLDLGMTTRVLLDATAIPVDRGGVGRYIEALLPVLQDEGVKIYVVAQPRDMERFEELAPELSLIAAPRGLEKRERRFAWEQVELPRVARHVKADVLHSPHYTMPRFTDVPVVVTLHDATFFSHPELHSRIKAKFFSRAISNAVRRAAALVVPSNATRMEVKRFAGGQDAQFYVAHHGVETDTFHPVSDSERRRVHAELGLAPEEEYVGFLGTLEPRKNVPALIRAWRSIADTLDRPVALVLAGGSGWDDEIAPTIAAVPSELRVIRPGYLPLESLPGFLSGASVLAYPSLGEGFGLPVLEAMACGAAVLTTRELSLPEVGGEAVEYCGTSDSAIAQGLLTLLSNAARRKELSIAAQDRAALFTWERAAEVHRKAYWAASRS